MTDIRYPTFAIVSQRPGFNTDVIALDDVRLAVESCFILSGDHDGRARVRIEMFVDCGPQPWREAHRSREADYTGPYIACCCPDPYRAPPP